MATGKKGKKQTARLHSVCKDPQIFLPTNLSLTFRYYIALSMQDGKAVRFGIIFSGIFSSIRIPHFKDGHAEFPNDAPPWASKFLTEKYRHAN